MNYKKYKNDIVQFGNGFVKFNDMIYQDYCTHYYYQIYILRVCDICSKDYVVCRTKQEDRPKPEERLINTNCHCATTLDIQSKYVADCVDRGYYVNLNYDFNPYDYYSLEDQDDFFADVTMDYYDDKQRLINLLDAKEEDLRIWKEEMLQEDIRQSK